MEKNIFKYFFLKFFFSAKKTNLIKKNYSKSMEKVQKNKFIKTFFLYAPQFLSSFFGCVLTFYIGNFADMNIILVCEALVLIYSLLLPSKYDDIFFIASLAGITSKKYLPNAGFIFLLGGISFIVYKIYKKICVGFGGKYGTLAFISNLIVCFLVYLSELKDYEYPFFDFKYYQALNIYIYIFGPIVCGTSCLLSYIFHNYFGLIKHVGANTNGLLHSLLLLLILESPEYDGDKFFLTYGQIYTIFAHIGLLCSLMKEDLLKKISIKGYMFYHYFLIGYFAGWIEISLFGVFILGGKNGIIGFLSCNFYVRTLRLIYKFPGKNKKNSSVEKEQQDEILQTSDEAKIEETNGDNHNISTNTKGKKIIISHHIINLKTKEIFHTEENKQIPSERDPIIFT